MYVYRVAVLRWKKGEGYSTPDFSLVGHPPPV